MLRQAICDLRFRPGDRLVERDLCDQLGVSRTIVREVLRHLEAEGIVENIPHIGPTVARLSVDEAQQIYEIRGRLEAMAARACAERRSPALARNLSAALSVIRSAYKRHSPSEVLVATTAFYRLLFEGGGKSVAWAITGSLNARVNHLRALTISRPGRDKDGPQQMQRIVEAITKGDGPGAEKACLAHVATAAEIAAIMLAEQGDTPAVEAKRRTRRVSSD
jgi:DNA-binding GntR family transcriptional regulator